MTAYAVKKKPAAVVHPPCKEGSVHRWRIDPPNGPTSVGRCSRCRAKREFSNASATQYDGYSGSVYRTVMHPHDRHFDGYALADER